MTHLMRTVRRSTDVRPAGARRPLVVELREGGIIYVREAGRRVGYAVPLALVWTVGAKLEAERRAQEKAKEKAARKAARGASWRS